MDVVLVILLTLLLFPLVPAWKYNRHWGFRPLLAGGLVLVALVVLLSLDIIPLG